MFGKQYLSLKMSGKQYISLRMLEIKLYLGLRTSVMQYQLFVTRYRVGDLNI